MGVSENANNFLWVFFLVFCGVWLVLAWGFAGGDDDNCGDGGEWRNESERGKEMIWCVIIYFKIKIILFGMYNWRVLI